MEVVSNYAILSIIILAGCGYILSKLNIGRFTAGLIAGALVTIVNFKPTYEILGIPQVEAVSFRWAFNITGVAGGFLLIVLMMFWGNKGSTKAKEKIEEGDFKSRFNSTPPQPEADDRHFRFNAAALSEVRNSPVPTPTSITNETLISYNFQLRPDLSVNIGLPKNFTVREAERLSAFLKTLPVDSGSD